MSSTRSTTTPSARRRPIAIAALAASALALGLPAAAGASTVTLEGDTLVLRAAPGEANYMSVGPAEDPGELLVGDIEAPAEGSPACTKEYSSFTKCPMPSGGVRVEAGDGNDQINLGGDLPSRLAVTFDGGPGDDVLRGATFSNTAATLLGGDGDDKLHGGPGAEVLDGGAGDDEIDARKGGDVLRGGDGNDTLSADYGKDVGTDVIDGGGGYDRIEMNWQSSTGEYQPPIDVSIDGAANDGRSGEHDNVTSVERIYLTAGATLTGSDGADELIVFNAAGPSRLVGRGGDDKLSAFDTADVVDGGAGADTLEGGFGDDTITGGPGRDRIAADVAGTACHWIQCRMPHGNDTIDARDGEADSVDCGIGTDTVQADPIDTLAGCETVSTAPVVPPSTPVPAPKPGSDVSRPAGSVLTALRARRRGRAIVVSGRVAGSSAVRVTATRRGRRLARTTTPVRSGRFTARLRVRGSGRVRVTILAGTLHRTLDVR